MKLHEFINTFKKFFFSTRRLFGLILLYIHHYVILILLVNNLEATWQLVALAGLCDIGILTTLGMLTWEKIKVSINK